VSRRHEIAQGGFTLLELLVALAIAGILVLAQVAPFQRAIAARDRAEATLERTTAARVTLQRIAEELTSAVAVPGDRFAVADRTFDIPASDLRFATTSARRLRAGPQDPIEQILYRLEPPARGEIGGRLVKEQLPSVAAEGAAPAEAVVLEGVAAFRVRVLPGVGQPWTETWQGGDGGNREDLPRAVEVELALVEGDEPPVPFHIAVTLPLSGKKK
jgi:prepilin-type N-terminal cleavage/methylation domain-containing protein